MTLKLIDSGDGQRTYDSVKFGGGSGGVTWVSAPSGQTGTWLQFVGGSQNGRRWQDTSYTNDTLIAGFRAEIPSSNPAVANFLARFGEWDGGTFISHVIFMFNTSGLIEVRRNNDAGTLIGTSTKRIPWGSGVRMFEFKVKVDNSAGTAEMRIDEEVFIALSSVDTNNGGTAKCNTFNALGTGQGAAFGQALWKHRDIYVCGTDGSVNNDFLGVCKAAVKLVNAAGASAQFTPSAGSNHQNVDDGTTVDDDTTYNESDVVDEIDSFGLTSSGMPAGASIKGTQTTLIAKKTDADPRTIASLIRSGGTNYPQTTQALGTTYQGFREIQENDPDTAAPWTQPDLDDSSTELGYKLIS